jgi:hypothetical protein
MVVLTVAVVVGTLAGCSGPEAQEPAIDEVQLTQANSGEQVALQVGQEIVVTLEGGANYAYDVEVEDPQVVTQVGRVSVGVRADRGMLRFQALGEGESSVQIEYHPIGSPNTQTMTLQVVVR